jgi:hypothetical protein
MESLVFRCAQTGTNVQVWLPEGPQPERADSYEAVTCPACARVHLINRKTGKMLSKMLGDKDKEQ